MPRVKIDHIISFSSEDPEYPAQSLVEGGAGGRGWRCGRQATGQPLSVCLQLARAARVTALTVGACGAATIEVLAGRQESPDSWEVLAPTCVLLPPPDCRRLPPAPSSSEGARVRSWSAADLTEAAQRSWDRLRVVLTQPYNKQVQFGLSFIHVSEPEPSAPVPSAPLLSAPLPLELQPDSDEEFRPGELFAARLNSRPEDYTPTTTDAQIRKATSQVIKNIDHTASKLNRSFVKQLTNSKTSTTDSPENNSYISDNKYHTSDNESDKIHNKRDRTDSKRKSDNKGATPDNKRQRADDKPARPSEGDGKNKDRDSGRSNHERLDNKRERTENKHERPDNKRERSDSKHERPDNKRQRPDNKRGMPDNKRERLDNKKEKPDSKREKAVTDPLRPGARVDVSEILRGVQCVFSGYEGAERARLRGLATAMGARVLPDWGPSATHLICAFPNTPKLRAATEAVGRGGVVAAALAQWLQASRAACRRLPWQWYATLPKHRVTPTDLTDEDSPACSEECDTDDEIERAVRSAPKAAAAPLAADSPAPAAPGSPDSAVFGASTPPRRPLPSPPPEPSRTKAVPLLWAGRLFGLAPGLPLALDRALLGRYIAAAGGTLLQDEEVSAGVEPHYWLCDSEGDSGDSKRRDSANSKGTDSANSEGSGVRVRADWVWRCIEKGRLLPIPPH